MNAVNARFSKAYTDLDKMLCNLNLGSECPRKKQEDFL